MELGFPCVYHSYRLALHFLTLLCHNDYIKGNTLRSLLKNYRLLYVEDETGIQKNMTEYLEGYFKNVYVANDGKEGLEAYHTHKPDALLLDINIPYIDGLTLAKTIRKIDKNVAIIMLTAFTDTDKLLQATELKLLKYLVKPLDLLEFQDTLDLLAKELNESSQNIVRLDHEYTWQVDMQQLFCENEIVALTSKEERLFSLLVKNKNNNISFEDIMAYVWVDEFEREVSVNCVKNVLSDLRKKLPKDAIKSIYGTGYMLH